MAKKKTTKKKDKPKTPNRGPKGDWEATRHVRQSQEKGHDFGTASHQPATWPQQPRFAAWSKKRTTLMPKVNGQSFPYTPAGKKAATAARKKKTTKKNARATGMLGAKRAKKKTTRKRGM